MLIISMTYIILICIQLQLVQIFSMMKTGTVEEIFTKYLNFYLKFAQCTWNCTWHLHKVLEYLYLKLPQSTWTCTCLNFQQKYLYLDLYLAKLKVLVLVLKYIADVFDPSLASIVVSRLMASIIVASHSQR